MFFIYCGPQSAVCNRQVKGEGRQKWIDANSSKQTGTLIAGAALAPYALSEANRSRASTAAGRLVLPMNRKWRYSRTVVEGGHAKDFDDSGFDQS